MIRTSARSPPILAAMYFWGGTLTNTVVLAQAGPVAAPSQDGNYNNQSLHRFRLPSKMVFCSRLSINNGEMIRNRSF